MNDLCMHYRLGTSDDLPEICNMIVAARQLMSEQGIEQWDDKYPIFEDFEDDISKETLYVASKGKEIR